MPAAIGDGKTIRLPALKTDVKKTVDKVAKQLLEAISKIQSMCLTPEQATKALEATTSIRDGYIEAMAQFQVESSEFQKIDTKKSFIREMTEAEKAANEKTLPLMSEILADEDREIGRMISASEIIKLKLIKCQIHNDEHAYYLVPGEPQRNMVTKAAKYDTARQLLENIDTIAAAALDGNMVTTIAKALDERKRAKDAAATANDKDPLGSEPTKIIWDSSHKDRPDKPTKKLAPYVDWDETSKTSPPVKYIREADPKLVEICKTINNLEHDFLDAQDSQKIEPVPMIHVEKIPEQPKSEAEKFFSKEAFTKEEVSKSVEIAMAANTLDELKYATITCDHTFDAGRAVHEHCRCHANWIVEKIEDLAKNDEDREPTYVCDTHLAVMLTQMKKAIGIGHFSVSLVNTSMGGRLLVERLKRSDSM